MKRTNQPIRRSVGFTLVEVMIAIGILAVALPMVATSLMAGMIAKKGAVEKTMATIVSENAISLLQTRATHQDLAAWGTGSMQRLPPGVISEGDKLYRPCGRPSLYAFEILGHRMAAGANDYRFAVLVYRKYNDSDTVSNASVTFDSGGLASDYQVVLSGASESAAIYCYLTRMSLPERGG